MTQILLAHSHEDYRDKLIAALAFDELDLLEIEPTFGSIVYQVEKHEKPLLLADEFLLTSQAFENIATIRRRFPDLGILCLSAQNNPTIIARLINEFRVNGVMGCEASSGEILLAIKAADLGALIVSSDISMAMGAQTELDTTDVTPFAEGKMHSWDYDTGEIDDVAASEEDEDIVNQFNMPQLTGREIEVLHLIARGLRSKQIGPLLNISARTVETHRANIRKKINGKGLNVMIALSNKILANNKQSSHSPLHSSASFLTQ